MTIWRMCIARRIPKAAPTHLEYVMLIAEPLHQWLHEWASVLPYTLRVLFVLKCLLADDSLHFSRFRIVG